MNPAPFLLIGRPRCGAGRLSLQCQRLSYFSSSSASDELVLTTVDENAGVAMLTMNRPPANSLSLEMNAELCASIKNVESNPKIQSVVLASSNPRIFSAGLDISELVSPDDEERLPEFWNSLQQLYVDLYGSRLATVAAIGGHAPAAGCFLAVACDYRVMSAGGDDDGTTERRGGAPTIGMNETRLGIAAPPWMGRMLVRTVGWRRAELALALGTLFPPDDALRVGLVDEVASRREESSKSNAFSDESDGDALLELLPSVIKGQASDPVMQRAYVQAKLYAKIPPQARVKSKLVTREGDIKDMVAKREEDTRDFCQFVMQDSIQSKLASYVEALKKSRKK